MSSSVLQYTNWKRRKKTTDVHINPYTVSGMTFLLHFIVLYQITRRFMCHFPKSLFKTLSNIPGRAFAKLVTG